MKKNINKIIFLFLGMIVFVGCSDMNDKHEIYMQDGERIYLGKVDSVSVMPGDMRAVIRFWAVDPRVKSAIFQWIPNNDSVKVPVVRTSVAEPIEFILGRGGVKEIPEGSYTFKIITASESKNRSIPVEKIINIYGEFYQSSLSNRSLKKATAAVPNQVSFEFSKPINEEEIGIKINYVDTSGKSVSATYLNSEISTPLVVGDIDTTKELSYSSLYKPEPNAVDVFVATSRIVTLN